MSREGYNFLYPTVFSLTVIISVNNFRFSTNNSETVKHTSKYYISLEMYFQCYSGLLCCIKIHAEMAKTSQVKDSGFILTSAPVKKKIFFKFYVLILIYLGHKTYKLVDNKNKLSIIRHKHTHIVLLFSFLFYFFCICHSVNFPVSFDKYLNENLGV